MKNLNSKHPNRQKCEIMMMNTSIKSDQPRGLKHQKAPQCPEMNNSIGPSGGLLCL